MSKKWGAGSVCVLAPSLSMKSRRSPGFMQALATSCFEPQRRFIFLFQTARLFFVDGGSIN